MTRRGWVVAFLALTGTALGAELVAALDSSSATVPWTELIVTYVPWEVTAAVLGALIGWLPAHLGWRYWRRRRDRPE